MNHIFDTINQWISTDHSFHTNPSLSLGGHYIIFYSYNCGVTWDGIGKIFVYYSALKKGAGSWTMPKLPIVPLLLTNEL